MATSQQRSLFEDYDGFVKKFKPKKTTDDCYTPPAVYDVVRDWACDEFDIDPGSIVRPFYPGGDYERFDYPDGCVVLDNPPFSILTEICRFYHANGIPFLLFAPGLTTFSTIRYANAVCTGVGIIYENGADVNTSFVTSFGDFQATTAPSLYNAVLEAVKATQKGKKAELPKYVYPDHVLTAATMNRLCKYQVDYSVERSQCVRIGGMDHQAKHGKAVFGGGLLLSTDAAAERAAAERAAAERAAAKVWQLSDRELEIVRMIDEGAATE